MILRALAVIGVSASGLILALFTLIGVAEVLMWTYIGNPLLMGGWAMLTCIVGLIGYAWWHFLALPMLHKPVGPKAE